VGDVRRYGWGSKDALFIWGRTSRAFLGIRLWIEFPKGISALHKGIRKLVLAPCVFGSHNRGAGG
jgi:hypothetical protein